jgi:hypothetical protein
MNHFWTATVCDKPLHFFRSSGQDPTVWVSLSDLLTIINGQLRGVVGHSEAHHEGSGSHQIVTAYRGRGIACQLTPGRLGLELQQMIIDAIEAAELEAGWVIKQVEPQPTMHWRSRERQNKQPLCLGAVRKAA